MPAIEVKNLSKTYTSYRKAPGLAGAVKSLFKRDNIEVAAVKSISFCIEAGELVGFLGPNGAGKTTTLKMLSGILTPTAGEMSVLGHNPAKREPALQKQFALVMGQKNQLWWDLPANDSFELNRDIYEIPEKLFQSRKNELVKRLEVRDLLDVPVRKLSLGERMKMELIGALLHEPKVLFLDEPTIGLDIIAQTELRRFITKYNQEAQTTIILTSHYMQDVEALCRRIIVINEGLIVYDGELRALKEKFADVKIAKVRLQAEIKNPPADLGKVLELKDGLLTIEIKRSEIKEKTDKILETLPVADLSIEDVPVEEVIKHIFQRHEKL